MRIAVAWTILPDVIGMINREGHVSRMGKPRKYKIVFRISKGKRAWDRCRWQNNVKMDRRNIAVESMDLIQLVREWNQWINLMNTATSLLKRRKSFHRSSDFEFLKEPSAAYSLLLLYIFWIYFRLLVIRWRSSVKSRSQQHINAILPSTIWMMCAVLISVILLLLLCWLNRGSLCQTVLAVHNRRDGNK